MQTYTITRNDQDVTRIYASSQLEAARIFANRTRRNVIQRTGRNTFQEFAWSRTTNEFTPVGQPFSVEA